MHELWIEETAKKTSKTTVKSHKQETRWVLTVQIKQTMCFQKFCCDPIYVAHSTILCWSCAQICTALFEWLGGCFDQRFRFVCCKHLFWCMFSRTVKVTARLTWNLSRETIAGWTKSNHKTQTFWFLYLGPRAARYCSRQRDLWWKGRSSSPRTKAAQERTKEPN